MSCLFCVVCPSQCSVVWRRWNDYSVMCSRLRWNSLKSFMCWSTSMSSSIAHCMTRYTFMFVLITTATTAAVLFWTLKWLLLLWPVNCPATDFYHNLAFHCQGLWQAERDACTSNRLHPVNLSSPVLAIAIWPTATAEMLLSSEGSALVTPASHISTFLRQEEPPQFPSCNCVLTNVNNITVLDRNTFLLLLLKSYLIQSILVIFFLFLRDIRLYSSI